MRDEKEYTKADVGCHADGAAGWDHVRDVLADLVEPFDGAIATALRAEMSDDAWEEYEALDVLNSQCVEGCYFDFVNGDLLLVDEAEEG